MEDTNLPAKLESFDLHKKLKAAIQDKFAEIIPDDIWNGLIEKQIKEFFETTTDNTGYRTVVKPSEFSVITKELLKEKIRNDVKECLGKMNVYADAKTSPDKIVLDLVKEATPAVIQSLMYQAVSQAIAHLQPQF